MTDKAPLTREDTAMPRINVAEAERDFAKLVDRVHAEGIRVELERGNEVIALLGPAKPQSPLKVRDLNAFLQALPRLGNDAAGFSEDVRAIRRDLLYCNARRSSHLS
jgi:antitoxin (DNA-binding transcriptional repressor) of toxin-antitoxin stability system